MRLWLSFTIDLIQVNVDAELKKVRGLFFEKKFLF